jgi:hypothetical protein
MRKATIELGRTLVSIAYEKNNFWNPLVFAMAPAYICIMAVATAILLLKREEE